MISVGTVSMSRSDSHSIHLECTVDRFTVINYHIYLNPRRGFFSPQSAWEKGLVFDLSMSLEKVMAQFWLQSWAWD